MAQETKIKYCGRWRIDEYSHWQTRYFDSLELLQEYWRGFHSIIAPTCIKESYKITYEPLESIPNQRADNICAIHI